MAVPLVIGAGVGLGRVRGHWAAASASGGIVVGGIVVGVLVWLVPLAILSGPATLWREAVAHTGGHFAHWGGSLWTSDVSLGRRFASLLLQAGLGLWPLALCAAIAAIAAARVAPAERRRALVIMAVAAVPYGAWALVGQNVDHARHAAPLTVVACIAIALALAASSLPRLLAGAVVGATVALCVITTPTVQPWRRDAVAWIAANLGLERVVVVGTHLPRVATYYAPELRVERALDAADLERIVQAAPPGVAIVVASELPGLARARVHLEPMTALSGAVLYRASAAHEVAVQP